MPKKDPNKPRGKMSSYAFFVQTCREEHKRKHPGESVVFAEFSKRCADKWKEMTETEKHRFEEMAEKDKIRYDKEMAKYVPADGAVGGKRKRKTKDPNAPKRALSAFFFFCGEERPKVKETNPSWAVGDVAKELGRRWEACKNRPKYEKMAANDKERYEREMAAYKKGGAAAPAKRSKAAAKVVEEEDDDVDEDDEETKMDDEPSPLAEEATAITA